MAFYDTRRSARAPASTSSTRLGDGGQTFSTPTRLTAEQSPKINDSFEFGDYNGLDAVMSDVIAIFTDNRKEGGGSGDSVDVYAAGLSGGGGGGNRAAVTITSPANGTTVAERHADRLRRHRHRHRGRRSDRRPGLVVEPRRRPRHRRCVPGDAVGRHTYRDRLGDRLRRAHWLELGLGDG